MHRPKTLVSGVILGLLISLLSPAPPVAAQTEGPDAPGPGLPADVVAEPLDPGDPAAPVEPDAGTELVEERTPASRTYLADDGTLTTMLTVGPVNYETADGTWDEIDSTLVPVAGRGTSGWHNAANAFDVRLPGTADGSFGISADGVDLSYRVVGAPADARGGVDENVVSYQLDPERVLRYTSLADGLKEEVELAGPTAARRTDFQLDVEGGTIRTVESGGAEIVGDDGEVRMELPAPWAVDANGIEGPARLEIVEGDGGHRLSLVGDDAWLDDPARAWPVVLDPQVIIKGAGSGQDCYISSANPTGRNCTASTLRVGYEGGVRRNAFLSFPDLWSAIPANSQQVSAVLRLTAVGHTNASGSSTVKVHSASKAWTSNLNWNSWNGTTGSSGAWASAGGDFDTTSDTYNNAADVTKGLSGTTTGGFYLGVNHMVSDWLTKPGANKGFVLTNPTSPTTNDTVDFDSREAIGANQPALYISWKYREGFRRSGSYQSFPLTDRSNLSINRANLNANVAVSELDIRGTGQDLQISRYYNVRNDQSRGWSWSVGADTRLTELVDGSISFQEASGLDHLFVAKAAGGFWTPSGIDAKLVRTNADDYTLTFNKSNGKLHFQRRGDLLVPVSMTDRNDNKVEYTYTVVSGFPQITTVEDTQDRDVTVTWTSGRITKIQDWTGRNVSYTWDGAWLETARNADGKDTGFTYDGDDRIETITTPEGRLTTLTYSPVTDMVEDVIQRRDGSVSYTTTYTLYDTQGRTVVTDPNGNDTAFHWDLRDIVTRSVDALGHGPAQSNVFDGNDNATTIRSVSSGVFTYGYSQDGNSNLESIQSPSSGANQPSLETQYRYNTPNTSAGSTYLSSSSIDPQGKCQAFHYDAAGNLERVFDGATVSGGSCDGATSGAETEMKRNGDGTLDYVDDPNGTRTDYSYTGGNLTAIDHPSPQGDWTLVNDTLSRVSSVDDGTNTTGFVYDAMDRIVRLTYDGDTGCTSTTTCTTFVYDDDGNLESRTDNTGTTTFTYDGLSRLRGKTLPSGANACSSGGSAITLDYDGSGNLVTHCDAQGAITYDYDDADRMVGQAEPGGTCTPGSEVRCTEFQYDDDGRRTKVTYPTTTPFTVSYVYGDAGNGAFLSQVIGRRGLIDEFNISYKYADGPSEDTDTSLVRHRIDNLAGQVWSYGYDSRNRLCWANDSSGETYGSCTTPPTGATRWTYDTDGNRTSEVLPGPSTTTYKYDAANRLCWLRNPTSGAGCGSPPSGAETYLYDARGNQTERSDGFEASYNAKNQMSSVTHPGGSATTVAYADVDSTQRVQYGSTTFDNGPLGLARSVTGGTATTWTRDNDGALISQHVGTTSGDRYYYVLDRLGSVMGMVDDDGNVVRTYEYDPWGEETAGGTGSLANPWRFAGGYRDHARSLKLGTRYYDPTIGRFTQVDPLAGSVADPQVANRYHYASNNPTNNTDTSGYQDCALPWDDGDNGCAGGSLTEEETYWDAGEAVVRNTVLGGIVGPKADMQAGVDDKEVVMECAVGAGGGAVTGGARGSWPGAIIGASVGCTMPTVLNYFG